MCSSCMPCSGDCVTRRTFFNSVVFQIFVSLGDVFYCFGISLSICHLGSLTAVQCLWSFTLATLKTEAYYYICNIYFAVTISEVNSDFLVRIREKKTRKINKWLMFLTSSSLQIKKIHVSTNNNPNVLLYKLLGIRKEIQKIMS